MAAHELKKQIISLQFKTIFKDIFTHKLLYSCKAGPLPLPIRIFVIGYRENKFET